MQVSISVHHARWRAPLTSAHDSRGLTPRPLVLVRLQTADGVVGHGEAAPLESYDGVSVAAVLDGLAACEAVLRAADGDDHAATLAACRARCQLPQALAAIDLALWDLAGRQLDQPVWELLGETARPSALSVNAVVGADAPQAAAAEAAAAVAAGYHCVKIKIGHGDDVSRLAAVREAVGSEIALRLDANGAFANPARAIAALTALERFDIELCEEPVHGARALADVAAEAPMAIAADESTADPALFRAWCADAVCLKIAAAGGISALLDEAETARDHGYEIYLASTLDGPLGVAAALHAAAALGPDRPCGFSTLERFAVPSPLPIRAGRMALPEGPGLGDGLIDWYAQSGPPGTVIR